MTRTSPNQALRVAPLRSVPLSVSEARGHVGATETLPRWLLLRALSPYLRNRWIDRGKWFLIYHLNPKPGRDLSWDRLGIRECRMRGGSRIQCDLRHSAHRFVYFTGEYEVALTRFVSSVVGSNWTFVDVGANVGHYSLIAAPLVREVFSLEPNHRSRVALEANVRLNQFTNVRILPLAAGSDEAELVLHQSGDDIGGASLVHRSPGMDDQRVRVVRGDDVVDPTSGPTYLKVDVEGFEDHALRGFSRLLSRDDVVVQVEVTDSWLRRGGSSAEELFGRLASFGFRPNVVRVRSFIRSRPQLVPIEAPLCDFQYDAVFHKRTSVDAFWAWVESTKA